MRWKLVEEEDAGGQGALFAEEEIVERHVGTGEYRGLEFLHVRARKIINEVPGASQLPFRWTINAYRGCSHACTYCLSGDTPVLLGNGRHVPISELEVGTEIYGTQRVGSYRAYKRTTVLAKWETIKRAYRVTLADGTTLVASGDHRFLTNRGWKHVTGTRRGEGRRPHLTTMDHLIGTGAFADPATTEKRDVEGDRIENAAALRVVSVEDLGLEIPMYDITTGTGDFIANGVVSHNCFARPTHDYLGLNIGSDFDSKIVVKVNAVERLRSELAGKRWAGDHIAMGTNTDPYQRCEGKYHLTQGIIKVLGEFANPFSILTKSTLILRDLPLLQDAAKRTEVGVNFSIGTLDERTWKATEPGTPHPRRRVEAVRRINEAGIPCGVLIAPIIPGLSDGPEQIEEVVRACVDAGAVSITAIPLHLRKGVKEHWITWLRDRHPELVPIYAKNYRGAYLPKPASESITNTVRRVLAETGFRNRPRPSRSEDRDSSITESSPNSDEGVVHQTLL